MASSSSTNLPVIEKLKGRDNYSTWRFAMQTYLEHEDLWECVTGDNDNEKKNKRARAKIILCTVNYVHVQDTTTAKETWDKLKSAFEDSGLMRRVGLLKLLTTTKLGNCATVDEYVNTIITTAHKLNGIGFKVNEEWIGSLLLAGLPEEYKPMIKGLESSGTPITGDTIKTKLLQDIKVEKTGKVADSETALHIKTQKNRYKGNVNQKSWYLDSGTTAQVTMNDEWINKKSSSSGEQVITANKDTLSAISINQGCQTVNGKIKINGEIVTEAIEENNMYRLCQPVQKIHYVGSEDKAKIWHKRLGHMNRKNMSMLTHGYVTGIDYERPSSNVCISCVKGKQHKQPFQPSTSRSKELLQVVHSDLCGPMETISFRGSRYFLTFVDDCSRKVFVYFLETKDQVPGTLEEFKVLAEKQSDRQLKTLRSDNGREYINQRLLKFLKNNGIKHQTTVPYTPQQNGLAERINRTIVEKARCLLQDASLSNEFWAEAVATVVYLINHSPAKGLNGITPEEAWSNRKPDLQHLRIFGCKAMAHIPKQLRKKWDAKSSEYIFVGYYEDSKAYRLWDPEHRSIVKARDVIFLENTKTTVSPDPTKKEDSSQKELVPLIDLEDNAHIEQEDPANEEEDTEENQEIVRVSSEESESDDSDYVDSLESLQEQTLRRSNRVPKPKNFSDFIVYKAVVISDDPETVKEATKRPDRKLWIEAMQREYDSLLENKTWDLVDLPPSKTALTSKWIFKIKRNANGEIERHKARLVIRGCSQKRGIDYEETYSPVVRYGTIRVLFALAAKYDLDVDHIDAVTAFLHGDLTEEIYMRQPEGFVMKGKEAKVCRLHKAMYGLKQGSRAWNQRLNTIIQQIGFTQSKTDQYVYIYTKEDKKIIIAVYVDDLLIFSNDKKLKEITKSKLMKQFKMKDLGEVRHCLGLRITRDRDAGKIWIDQSAYIENIVN
ncbi:PREDICTED: retrovirus-related Pol polyprotein from transposon TNT 1-94 [Cyphomyrmex costatus]|uniref:retrovirus-related Pol polyprotein from transposon TNT 1-94 n=1 Tax=Cyphomyrmex costatus TaxID=456900 RepID=UPI0008522EC2|nr:PREDICTED: retrovirus-related Pol polyprotein from transposon TNT 1-94 [Cyphomyrmex costatus]